MSNRFFYNNSGKWDLGAVATRLKDAWFAGTVNARNGAFAGDVTMASLNGSALAGFRNRIINGDMRIDQRNNGASVTPAAAPGGFFIVDRWALIYAQNSKLTVGRNLGAGTLPNNSFQNYLGALTAAAYTALSTELFGFRQPIEGLNVADLGWGAAGASPVTVSFLAYSSIAGNHSGSVTNYAGTRTYPFLFTLSAANTWQLFSITIPGDTAGTWATDTGGSLSVVFNLGSGSSVVGTANTWTASNTYGVTGAVKVIGTLNATFRVTGVQVEPGSVATPFERRSFGTELSLCQRYYYATNFTTPTGAAVGQHGGVAIAGSIITCPIHFPVPLRAAPTIQVWNNGVQNQVRNTVSNTTFAMGALTVASSPSGFPYVQFANSLLTAGQGYDFDLVMSAEL